MKIAICVGHDRKRQGAILEAGAHTITEYDYNYSVASALAMMLPQHESQIFARSGKGSVGHDIYKLSQRVNAFGADVAIDLHFNSWHDAGAHGCEMLHWPGSEGQYLAGWLAKNAAEYLGVQLRHGDGTVSRTAFAFLRWTQMPAVICEPAFASHEGDAYALLSRQALLAVAYARALNGYGQAPIA